MSAILRFLLAIVSLCGLFALPASAEATHVHAELIAEQNGVSADGGTITVALHQVIEPNWHTYWRNPGDAGEPTAITWQLPPGFQAGDIQWPYPTREAVPPLLNFGYSNEVFLLTDIAVPKGLRAGDHVTLKANATWLVCEKICVPEDASLELTLPVVEIGPFPNLQWHEKIEAARRQVPLKSASFPGIFAVQDNTITLFFKPTLDRIEKGEGALFFPFEQGLIKNATQQAAVQADGGFGFRIPVGSAFRDPARANVNKIDGVLVLGLEPKRDGIKQSFEVSLTRGAVPALPVAAASGHVGAGGEAPIGLFTAIGFALLGGLILNLMPCVFPILSMKAIALVRSHHAERPWGDGVAYTLGVLATFAALAAGLMALRSAGEDIGWGFQLQSPLAVAVLAYVLVLVGLDLSGVFEIGGSIQGVGSELSSRNGLVGAFFTGVLAVIVAAPCTAPFMGAAMGFAFTQSPVVIFAVFLTLGFGLALPWLLISLSPHAVALLPKPGPWMVRFKQLLAFPMYGAAAWLIWVLSQQVTPEGLFRVMIGVVALAFAAWGLGVAQARGAEGRSRVTSFIATAIGLALAIGLVAMPFAQASTTSAAVSPASDALSGEPYSEARLADLRGQNKPVLVNLTAAWCITCLYNERVALSSKAVADAFKETNTVYLVGDWTNRNAEIARLLQAHGREGVPLYLYYPPGGEAKILPQMLDEKTVVATLKGESR
ncbi:MAG: thiol:disulfide interchange protein [Alphaproteobacteria bacterium]|nr:thiol:disulfide interchange protein [Alphaproteobacteria bacterium]